VPVEYVGTSFDTTADMRAAVRNIDHSEQPTAIKPMLSTLVKQPFSDDSYVFEVKWDGYRIIAFCQNNSVKLQSRGGEDYTRKYPSIVNALKKMNLNCVLDGEVVYINDEGKPDFDSLQRVNGHEAPMVYYVFDLLWIDGQNLMKENLVKRKERLKKLLSGNQTVRYSDHFEDGVQLFENIKDIGLEGIVGKQKHSQYIPGDRSKRWLKVTTEKRQEFVIGGWVESEKRNTFRTLLFGSYENGKLKWKGHAGGGYREREMPGILNRLQKIEINENPFDTDVEYSEGKPHWVRPELVANIKYATTTRGGKIRKPAIFLGFRDDKKASQVETEIAKSPPAKRSAKRGNLSPKLYRNSTIRKSSLRTATDSNWRELEQEPIRNQDEFEVDSCTLTFYNVDRELWKGITKAKVIEYYNTVAKYILPHLQDRPLSLHVKPKGPNAPGLYIKDMEGRTPDCGDIFPVTRKHKKAGKRNIIDYLVCNNTATLLYIANLGCIDINPWTSTTSNSLEPDFVIIDLDPSDEDFKKAIETAKASKEFFDKHQLKAFVKTSGKTGIHLFVPCSSFTFPQARTIAQNICSQIHEMVPTITTTEVTIANRGSKLYLDPNQNDYADTVASAYSIRPYKRPTVSTPLEWKEVNNKLSPEKFTITSIPERLRRKGDLFIPTLDKKVGLKNNKQLKIFL
jgi:bifunctional non-homologous end joining protein LigD